MANLLAEIEALLLHAEPVTDPTPTATLRAWRHELVRGAVFISYAIGVLSLDAAVLKRARVAPVGDVLAHIVDDLPGIMARGWVGGGWSLAPDASASVAAAAEIDLSRTTGLLELHSEMVTSDLSDRDVVADLSARIEVRREELSDLKQRVEDRIDAIQATVARQYKAGSASVDDWLH